MIIFKKYIISVLIISILFAAAAGRVAAEEEAGELRRLGEPKLQGAYSARVTAELPFWLGSWGVVSGRWYSDKASQIERLIVKDERKQTIFDSVALCDDSKVMPSSITKSCTAGNVCSCRRVKGCSALDLRVLNEIPGTLLRETTCDKGATKCAVWLKKFDNWEIELTFENQVAEANAEPRLRAFNVKNLWDVTFDYDEKYVMRLDEIPCEIPTSPNNGNSSNNNNNNNMNNVAVDILFPLREAVRNARKALKQ